MKLVVGCFVRPARYDRCPGFLARGWLGADGMAESARTPGDGRVADAFGHHASRVLIACIVAVVLLPVAPLPGLLVLVVPAALFALVLVSWVLMRQHDRRLCELCMLSMPLNPSEQAARYRRRFWMAHTGTEPRFLIPYLVVLISSNSATSTPGRVCWALMQLSLVYLVLAATTHRKLQPWCPWCSEDGGGDHVEDVPPVQPDDDRQLI